MINRNKAIEVITYVIVFLAIWVVSPILGKLLDSLYFNYPNVLASSIQIILPGIVIISLGTILALWTIFLFKTKGQGTPNPKLPPKKFIVCGPYKFTRNPMALGGLLILSGEAVFYFSPSLLAIAVLYGVIVYLNAMYVEEPELRIRFGNAYEDYLKQIPRFFPNPFH